jgi:hypothetical protein
MTYRPQLGDERGSSMVELLVGMAMGMIVLVGLSMVIIATLHGNARVDARVEATQNARLTVGRIVEQLHSACLSPRIIPIKESSTATKLVFVHSARGKAASEVAPTEIESTITLEKGILWETEGGVKRQLISNVAPGGGSAVFTYFNFTEGHLNKTPLVSAPSLQGRAAETVYVKVALTAQPRSNPTHDAGVAATVSDSATLRLTPPLYNTSSAPPCQ